MFEMEVSSDEAAYLARVMEQEIHQNIKPKESEVDALNKGCRRAVKAVSFLEMYSLKRGLREFKEKGEEA